MFRPACLGCFLACLLSCFPFRGCLLLFFVPAHEALATAMAVNIARFNCQGRPLTVLDLPDRRAAAQRHVRFLFLSDLEKVLYGGSTGAIYRLLQRESMERSVLPLKKASVGEGLVTQSEFDAILEAYRETVENVETRGRVRMCSLVRAPVVEHVPPVLRPPGHTHTLSTPPTHARAAGAAARRRLVRQELRPLAAGDRPPRVLLRAAASPVGAARRAGGERRGGRSEPAPRRRAGGGGGGRGAPRSRAALHARGLRGDSRGAGDGGALQARPRAARARSAAPAVQGLAAAAAQLPARGQRGGGHDGVRPTRDPFEPTFFLCALSRVTACAAVRYRALHAADSGDRVAQGERHGDGAALPRLRQGGPRSVAQPQAARHRRAAHHRASLARADGRARSHVVVAEQLRQLAVQPRRLVVGLGRCRRGGGVRARPAAADGADPAPRAVRAAEQAAAPLRQEAGQLDRLGHGAGGAPQVRARVGRRGAARARCKDRAALGVPRAALPHRHAARRAPSNLCPPCSHPAQGRTQPCPLLARSAWASSASCAGATR